LLKQKTGIKNPEAVLEQLRKKVGRLMGRRDIRFNDPIFYQPKNTLKQLEERVMKLLLKITTGKRLY
jgi:hypothetical protein